MKDVKRRLKKNQSSRKGKKGTKHDRLDGARHHSARKPLPAGGRRLSRKADLDRRASDFITGGVLSNTFTVVDWTKWLNAGEKVDLWSLQKSMAAAGERVRSGDLGGAEVMLMAEAVSLNAMFADLTHRAHVAEHLDNFDCYLRLALRAQSQCRATIETLAMMKHPPLFAKQANIAAGPQQINNSVINGDVARARIQKSAPNKLKGDHDERLDDGQTRETAERDPAMEAVEAFDRTADTTREAPRIPQRLPRR